MRKTARRGCAYDALAAAIARQSSADRPFYGLGNDVTLRDLRRIHHLTMK
jgi:hypothetical protein